MKINGVIEQSFYDTASIQQLTDSKNRSISDASVTASDTWCPGCLGATANRANAFWR